MEYKEVTLGPLNQRQMEKLVRFMADLLKDEGGSAKVSGGVFVASPTSGDEDEGAGPGG